MRVSVSAWAGKYGAQWAGEYSRYAALARIQSFISRDDMKQQ